MTTVNSTMQFFVISAYCVFSIALYAGLHSKRVEPE